MVNLYALLADTLCNYACTELTHPHVPSLLRFSELRQLAMRCDFGASLEEMLRDRLVCGIKDEHIQRRLLAEPNLTFKKAQDIAQALESADRNTADLQQQVQAAVPVHALKKSQKPKNDRGSSKSTSKDTAPSRSSPTCYRCGGKHLAPDFVGTKNQNVIPVGKRDTFPACAEAKERQAAIQSHLRARTRRLWRLKRKVLSSTCQKLVDRKLTHSWCLCLLMERR